jgi:hypothetical protein
MKRAKQRGLASSFLSSKTVQNGVSFFFSSLRRRIETGLASSFQFSKTVLLHFPRAVVRTENCVSLPVVGIRESTGIGSTTKIRISHLKGRWTFRLFERTVWILIVVFISLSRTIPHTPAPMTTPTSAIGTIPPSSRRTSTRWSTRPGQPR